MVPNIIVKGVLNSCDKLEKNSFLNLSISMASFSFLFSSSIFFCNFSNSFCSVISFKIFNTVTFPFIFKGAEKASTSTTSPLALVIKFSTKG